MPHSQYRKNWLQWIYTNQLRRYPWNFFSKLMDQIKDRTLIECLPIPRVWKYFYHETQLISFPPLRRHCAISFQIEQKMYKKVNQISRKQYFGKFQQILWENTDTLSHTETEFAKAFNVGVLTEGISTFCTNNSTSFKHVAAYTNWLRIPLRLVCERWVTYIPFLTWKVCLLSFQLKKELENPCSICKTPRTYKRKHEREWMKGINLHVLWCD